MKTTTTTITSSFYNHKRFKIALVGLIFCVLLSIIGICIQEYSFATVPAGGIPTIVVAYVAGDSYRQSIYDNNYYNDSQFNNPHNITE